MWEHTKEKYWVVGYAINMRSSANDYAEIGWGEEAKESKKTFLYFENKGKRFFSWDSRPWSVKLRRCFERICNFSNSKKVKWVSFL